MLCAPGQLFEIEMRQIRGISTRTWKNAPRNLGEVVTQGAATAGSRDFIVFDDERITHQRHLDLVDAFAASLVEDLGVRRGDRVAIAMRNLPEWSVAFFGAAKAGAVSVAINAFGSGEELGFAITDADAAVVVVDSGRLERLAPNPAALAGRTIVGTRLDDGKSGTSMPLPESRPFSSLVEDARGPVDVDVEPDDLASIFYTSGTTSRPKGVLGTHRNICSNLMSMMFASARTSKRSLAPPAPPTGPPVSLLSVPLFHATGCHSLMLSQAFFGGTLVLMPRWDPELALELIERERVTSFSGVPTMLWDVLNSPTLDHVDLSSVRNFGGGGAALPRELGRRIHERFPESGTSTGYGLTETSGITTSIGGDDYLARPDSAGAPMPVCEVRIADCHDTDVPSGTTGEIWVKGPNVVPGYWRRPDETKVVFPDGWLRTGDIGRLDDDQFLYIVDRAKDIVIRGGENISTLEVESVLFEHPSVLEVAVFATPHLTLGEEVGAVVRLSAEAGTSEGELLEHVARVLAPHKVPAHLWITDEPLPRGDTGKLIKRALQSAYAPLVGGSVTGESV
jgi:acyl-CoA synthetase (AMP-forming)/AMP-acid ligase II